MDIVAYSLLVIATIIIVYGILLFNRFVMLKHNVKKAWGNIDVLLKQRHDELPKLVAACKEYMKHEQETLEKVINARSQVASAREKSDVAGLGAAETMLRAGLGQLFALVENYPDLKANESFQQLQSRITGLENAIADRREFYNESVNVNNVGIEQFPGNLVADKFGFEAFGLLKFIDSEKTDVDVQGLFQS
jgi:LemA protein